MLCFFMELCAKRDNITTCDIASINAIIAMIEDIHYVQNNISY